MKAFVEATPISGPACVYMTRGLTANDITDRQEACAFLAGFLHGRQRIGRFSRLADSDHQALGRDDRIPVSKLRGIVYLDGHAGQRFDHKFSDLRRMQRRSHTDNLQALHAGQEVSLAEFASYSYGVVCADSSA